MILLIIVVVVIFFFFEIAVTISDGNIQHINTQIEGEEQKKYPF